MARNENGDPVKATEEWGVPIPCRFESEGKENIATNPDGSFTRYDFVVWIDDTSVDYSNRFVRLTNQHGKVVAENRQVQKCIPGQLRTKIYL